MGGMQALEWAVAYPDSVEACIPIATTARHSAQQIAFNETGRQAIMADPDFRNGDFYEHNAAGARTLRRPHGGAHYVHVGRVHAREVWPPPAGPPAVQLRLSMSTLRWRSYLQLSGQPVCRPL